jgi:hypothetical protein
MRLRPLFGSLLWHDTPPSLRFTVVTWNTALSSFHCCDMRLHPLFVSLRGIYPGKKTKKVFTLYDEGVIRLFSKFISKRRNISLMHSSIFQQILIHFMAPCFGLGFPPALYSLTLFWILNFFWPEYNLTKWESGASKLISIQTFLHSSILNVLNAH